MKHRWNWASLFDRSLYPTFTITPETLHCFDQFKNLTFEQGLRVIVSSAPSFENDRWQSFRDAIMNWDIPEHLRTIWLAVADAMRELMLDVRHLLNYEISQATHLAEALFESQDMIGRCAIAGYLYCISANNIKAEMILRHLVHYYDHSAQQIAATLVFFNALTPRLREVAILAGFGYSNQEIADELFLTKAVVAEYLTSIFCTFAAHHAIATDTRGTRYRLIHYLTRLFEYHPELLLTTLR